MSINKRLKSYFDENRIKQVELAEVLDTSPQTVSNLMIGKYTPSTNILKLIANSYLDLNMRWVLTGVGEMYEGGDPSTIADFEIKLEACTDLCKILKKQLDDKELIIELLKKEIETLKQAA